MAHTGGIIRQLERDATIAALQYGADVAAFVRRQRVERMAVFVGDVLCWLTLRGDLDRLARGRVVSIEDGGGTFTLRIDGRTLVVRPRSDLSITIGDAVIFADPDCPVLDQRRYDEALGHIRRWINGTPLINDRRISGKGARR